VIRVLKHWIRSAPTARGALSGAALCACVAVVSAGQSANRGGISQEVRSQVRQAIASIGLLSVRNTSDASPAPRPRGSSVIVRSDGVLVTNHHVITNTRTGRPYDEIFLTLSSDGEMSPSSARYRLKLLLINKDFDLALLRVVADAAGMPIPKSFTFPTIAIGDSRRIRVLEDLFIIGFPEGGGSTVTVNRGVVEGRDILANWIKTDARVIRGNSGGAAVSGEGQLIGIPTKVVADEQPVDRDGDGFPDDSRKYGAVGFLRPSHLVKEMLAQIGDEDAAGAPAPAPPKQVELPALVTVRGIVRSSGGKPVAGALVGLVPLGEGTVTESTLLTWGSTNAEGAFKLNKPVPPGRYTLKAKAIANEPYSSDVEIGPSASSLMVEMRSLTVR
jgi:S1-C subfamily serine protease